MLSRTIYAGKWTAGVARGDTSATTTLTFNIL